MLLYGLDKNYETIGVPIDTWTTAIWYVRYNQEGEMSLYLPPEYVNSPVVQKDNYILNPMFPETLCIVEATETKTSAINGPQIVVTGRSLESILRRRIIWDKMAFENASLQDSVEQILNQNVISPNNSNRRIPGFTFSKSADTRITSLRLTASYHGENVYEVIQELCANEQIGFKVIPTSGGGFQFSLYVGTDRSYNQSANPYVVFSREYENLAETTNTESKKNIQNAALVYNTRTKTEKSGEEYVSKEIETSVEAYGSAGTVSGLDRRELYISSYKSNKKDDDSEMSDAEYRAVLQNEGTTELANHEIESVYTGEIDPSRQFKINEDYFIGDVVQFVNEYKQEGRVRIAEIIHSHDDEGEKITPTFVNVP